MQNKNSFVTTHVIPMRTDGTLYYFPKTLRDVYAFRVRLASSLAGFSSYGAVLHIISPDLVSGYRTCSQFGQLCYSIA